MGREPNRQLPASQRGAAAPRAILGAWQATPAASLRRRACGLEPRRLESRGSAAPRSPKCVVRGVISRHPALQFRPRVLLALHGALRRLGIVQGKFEDQIVWIGHIDGPAVAVLEYKRPRLLVPGRGQPLLDAFLRLAVHVERDMVKRRTRHLRSELLLIRGIRKFEEGQGPAIRKPEEQVTIS